MRPLCVGPEESSGFGLLTGGEEDACRTVNANVLLQFGWQDGELLDKATVDRVMGDSLPDSIKEGFANLRDSAPDEDRFRIK